MKKISALIMLIATAILSGVALNKFLNWAGKQEDFFDFDLNEDIDHEEIQITHINSIGHSNYLDIWHTGAIEINSQLFISRPFKGLSIGDTKYDLLGLQNPRRGLIWDILENVASQDMGLLSPKHFFRTFYTNCTICRICLYCIYNNDKTQPEADPIGFCIHPKMQGTGNMWDATTRTHLL